MLSPQQHLQRPSLGQKWGSFRMMSQQANTNHKKHKTHNDADPRDHQDKRETLDERLESRRRTRSLGVAERRSTKANTYTNPKMRIDYTGRTSHFDSSSEDEEGNQDDDFQAIRKPKSMPFLRSAVVKQRQQQQQQPSKRRGVKKSKSFSADRVSSRSSKKSQEYDEEEHSKPRSSRRKSKSSSRTLQEERSPSSSRQPRRPRRTPSNGSKSPKSTSRPKRTSSTGSTSKSRSLSHSKSYQASPPPSIEHSPASISSRKSRRPQRKSSTGSSKSDSTTKQTRRPRRSNSKGSKSPAPLESRHHRQKQEGDDNDGEANFRRSLGKKSKSFRKSSKSPTPLESDRPRPRRSLSKKSMSFRKTSKSPTPLESRQQREEEEENSRRSLSRKSSLSFRKKSPAPREKSEDRPRPRRSLSKKSISFRNLSSEPKRSLTPEHLRPSRRSMGKKSKSARNLSFKNLFHTSTKNQPQEVDWKGMGFKECSYYKHKTHQSAGSLGKKYPGPLKRLSSLRNISFKGSKDEDDDDLAVEGSWHNAAWDYHDCEDDYSGSGSKVVDTPGPLKQRSAFRRILSTSRSTNAKIQEEQVVEESRPIWRQSNIEEVDGSESQEGQSSQPLRRWSFEKKHKDVHLLASPRLEQVLLRRNERRKRRSDIKKKLLLGLNNRNSSDGSGFLDKTERDSSGRNSSELLTPSSHSYKEIEEEDDTGISISSSVAPQHNLKDEEVMLLLWRELEAMEQ